MYKRPARVLFVDEANADLSRIAQAWAQAEGDEWLEGRSAGITAASLDTRVVEVLQQRELMVPDDAGRQLDENLLAWADLVVAMTEASAERCPAMPVGTRLKPWGLAPWATVRGDAVAEAELVETIGQRIRSMIGGMRMLARSDAGEEE